MIQKNGDAHARSRWPEAEDVEFVYLLNERFFELMSQAAASGAVAGFWGGLDARARKRAAHFPFALANVRFMDSPWWLSVCGMKEGMGLTAGAPVLPLEVAQPMTVETLMFAWRVAFANRDTASLKVGMAPEVSGLLARMQSHDVYQFAMAFSSEVGPRWPDRQEMWEGWTEAARGGNERRLSMIHLHAKLLIAGDLRSIGLKT